MTVRFEINPQDVERIRRITNDPEFVGRPRREMLMRMRRGALREARRPLSNAGTGLAHRSMRARYDETPKKATVTVYSLMRPKRAASIEQGEPPGRTAPVRRLIKWTAATGDPRDPWVVQRHLRTRGVVGKRMIGGAVGYVRGRLPEYFREMADKMERRWARG